MVMLVSEGNGLWLPLTPEYLIQLTSYLPDVAKIIIFGIIYFKLVIFNRLYSLIFFGIIYFELVI